MSEAPSFGFGAKLAAIQPTGAPTAPREGEIQKVDRVAERAGFSSREPVARRKKRQGFDEPMDQINIRAPIADINAFVEWCEENRFTSGQGFRELIRRIPDGN